MYMSGGDREFLDTWEPWEECKIFSFFFPFIVIFKVKETEDEISFIEENES